MKPSLVRLADWVDHTFDADEEQRLIAYADWLASEGVTIGGIGPGESEQLWDRHIADSLVFLKDLEPGATVLDVGSGVGLPGIPVAIVHNGPVTLIDRSGRRVDALRRISRILDLDVRIVQTDVSAVTDRFDRIMLRASLNLETARRRLPPLLRESGEIWFALSRVEDGGDAVADWRNSESPDGMAESLLQVPIGVLDSPAWILRLAVGEGHSGAPSR